MPELMRAADAMEAAARALEEYHIQDLARPDALAIYAAGAQVVAASAMSGYQFDDRIAVPSHIAAFRETP